MERYKGQFDKGWDEIRKEAFAKQKASGVIPANAEAAPRPDGLPAWDSLTAQQKKLLAHAAEVYAGYTEHTDHEIGRLLDALREEGQAESTVILWVFSPSIQPQQRSERAQRGRYLYLRDCFARPRRTQLGGYSRTARGLALLSAGRSCRSR